MQPGSTDGFLDKTELTERGVYVVQSRNLAVAVYVGSDPALAGHDGFIGIREKLGYEYLDAEYGTVRVQRLIGTLPDGIEMALHGPLWCYGCNRPATRPVPPQLPPYVCEGGCDLETQDVRLSVNQSLFDFLKPLDDAESAARVAAWKEQFPDG